jgi:ribose-phosphate pyrophosphokinase
MIAFTDSLPLPAEKRLPNMHVITVADLLASAIKRIHGNESVSVLFQDASGERIV